MQAKITHFLFIGLLFFTVNQISAQSSFKLDPKTSRFIDKSVIECIYKYTVNAPLKKSQTNEKQLVTYTTILQASGTVSKFWDWHSFKKDSTIYASASYPSSDSITRLQRMYDFALKYMFIPVVFKNYPNEKITVTDEINPGDYIYEEKKSELDWTLMEDTLTVCGYPCNKAVTSFGGMEWTVWYAPDLALSDGPWKLYGLPGLILKACDSTHTHSFEASIIRKSDRPIYITKNFMQFKVEKGLFVKNKNRYEEDPKGNSSASRVVTISVYGNGATFINGKRSSLYLETKYCPLELK